MLRVSEKVVHQIDFIFAHSRGWFYFQTWWLYACIANYNKYMGGGDAFDEIKSGSYGADNNGKTLRYYECLFNMALADAYNVHRFLNSHSQMSHADFLLHVFSEWKNSEFRRAVVSTRSESKLVDANLHTLTKSHLVSVTIKLPDGQRKEVMWHYRAKCRVCAKRFAGSKTIPKSIYHCQICMVSLCPDGCFEDFHRNTASYSRIRNRGLVNAAENHTWWIRAYVWLFRGVVFCMSQGTVQCLYMMTGRLLQKCSMQLVSAFMWCSHMCWCVHVSSRRPKFFVDFIFVLQYYNSKIWNYDWIGPSISPPPHRQSNHRAYRRIEHVPRNSNI